MIELTADQVQALNSNGSDPPRIVHPRTGEVFVLLRSDEYERLRQNQYDDEPWTREELEALAWKTSEDSDWEEYQDAPETP
jgi:hypothetical protein